MLLGWICVCFAVCDHYFGIVTQKDSRTAYESGMFPVYMVYIILKVLQNSRVYIEQVLDSIWLLSSFQCITTMHH